MIYNYSVRGKQGIHTVATVQETSYIVACVHTATHYLEYVCHDVHITMWNEYSTWHDVYMHVHMSVTSTAFHHSFMHSIYGHSVLQI